MARSRDIRLDIRDRLLATAAFAEVRLTAPEESGLPAGDLTAATIEPVGGKKKSRWDGGDGIGLLTEEECLLTILVRDRDPQTRDEKAEQLLAVAENAIDGASLAGITAADLTCVGKWQWRKAVPPERRITATVAYSCLPVGWDSNDDSE